MKYPARLSEDLKYLAAWYEWTSEEKTEIRAMFNGCEVTVNFLMALAAAHRAGYNDPAGNSFMTLDRWCAAHALPSPFDKSFTRHDLEEIDAMAKA